ncbi:MAG: hypothetical protein R3B54_03790 [Bdellovibrionota bacterium]
MKRLGFYRAARGIAALGLLSSLPACLFSLSMQEDLESRPTPVSGGYVLDYDNIRNDCLYVEESEHQYRVTCRAVAADSNGNEHEPISISPGLELRFEDPNRIFGSEYSVADCGGDTLKRCYLIDLDEVVSTKIEFPLSVSAPNREPRTEKEEILIPYSIRTIGVMPEFPAQYRTIAQQTGTTNTDAGVVPLVQRGFENVALSTANFPSELYDICFRGNDAYLMAGSGGQYGGFIYRIAGSVYSGQHRIGEQVSLYAGSVNMGNYTEYSSRLRIRFGQQTRMACHPDGLLIVDEAELSQDSINPRRILFVRDEGPVELLGSGEAANFPQFTPSAPATFEPIFPVVGTDNKIYVAAYVNSEREEVGIFRILGKKKMQRVGTLGNQRTIGLYAGIAVDPTTLYFAQDYGREFSVLNTATGSVTSLRFTQFEANEPPFHLGGSLAKDASGRVYVASPFTSDCIWRLNGTQRSHYMGKCNEGGYAGDGENFSSSAIRLQIRKMAFAGEGSLYMTHDGAETGSGNMRRVDRNGKLTTVWQSRFRPVTDGAKVKPAETVFHNIVDVELGPNGEVYYAVASSQYGYNRIRTRIAPNGVVTTLAGAQTGPYVDGPALAARMDRPRSLHLATDGSLYFTAESLDYVRRYHVENGQGMVTTVAGRFGDGRYNGFSGDGGPAVDARFFNVRDVVSDASGNFYLSDSVNTRVRKVDTEGIVTTAIGGPWNGPCLGSCLSSPEGLSLDAAGHLWVVQKGVYYASGGHRLSRFDMRDPSNPQLVYSVGDGTSGFAGDGGSAQAAKLNEPTRIASDSTGRIYFVDQRETRVRVLEPSTNDDGSTDYSISTLFGGSSAVDCGSGTIEGFSTLLDLNERIRASLSVICVAIIRGLDVTDNCDADGGSIRIAIAQWAALQNPTSNITQITRSCR